MSVMIRVQIYPTFLRPLVYSWYGFYKLNVLDSVNLVACFLRRAKQLKPSCVLRNLRDASHGSRSTC